MKDNPFKVGDWVRCISTPNWVAEDRFKPEVGKVYKVVYVSPGFIRVVGNNYGWSKSRFKLDKKPVLSTYFGMNID